VKVWMGDSGSIPILIKKDLILTLQRHVRKGMKVKVVVNSPVSAPITKGDVLGILKIETPNHKSLEFPLVSGVSVKKLGLFSKLGAGIEYVLWGETR
jgi:D-alanyl-D-alanine carboxypeptidase (penicillin-binding protein 5/6)